MIPINKNRGYIPKVQKLGYRLDVVGQLGSKVKDYSVSYLGDKLQFISPDNLPDKIWVFDFDGTIADIRHRLHFIQNRKRDYASFYANVSDDKPIQWVIDIMRNLPKDSVYIVSGRSDVSRDDSEKWLKMHDVPYSRMYMRWHHNFSVDWKLKLSMVDDFKDRIQFVVEDRQSVVDMWRDNNVNVLQPASWSDKNEYSAELNKKLKSNYGGSK
jgi:hypothetical protein